MSFTAKTYLYGPVTDVSSKVIKTAIVDTAMAVDTTAPRRFVIKFNPIHSLLTQMITSVSTKYILNLLMENQETQPQDKTSKIYGGIKDALEVETSLVSDITKDKSSDLAEPVESTPIQKQILKDYEYSRGQFYSLIEKGQEAVDGILDVAQQSDSPRAYEVAGNLIKNVGDTADKLMDLQKKLEEVQGGGSAKNLGNVTNNTMFVGSTAELAKFLKKQKDK
ncbi:MAG: hypothetical protein CM15mV13_2770 [uncultured marine virus]|nr:MAG: hypothetical protein CM15mV13_2770 [uncultured marine virus]